MKTPTSLLQHNIQQSALVFKKHEAMSKAEFITYAQEYVEHVGEGLFEKACEIQSEINMFGDSGPGSMYYLGLAMQEFNKVADRLTSFTGQVVQRPRMPYHP